MRKIIQKKIISYSSLFNKSWTNWIIKTETKKWKLGILNGIAYRPNQIVEKTNFGSRTHTYNPRTLYNPTIWNSKPKQLITRNVDTFNRIINKKFPCETCNRLFSRSSNLKIHKKTKHEHVSLNFSCYLCRKTLKIKKIIYVIWIITRKVSVLLYKSAFDRAIKIFRKPFKNYFSLYDILNEVNDIHYLFDVQILEYSKYKCSILIQVEYLLKGTDNTVLEKEIFNIRTSNFIISKTVSKRPLRKTITEYLFEIITKENDMNLPQSGWVSNRIILFEVYYHKMNLLLWIS